MSLTTEFTTIVNSINNDVLQIINKHLQPLVDRINSEHLKYVTMLKVLHNMPEFQSVVTENERLKQLLKEKENASLLDSKVELPVNTNVLPIASINLEVKETLSILHV